MATGASTANLAIILVDARNGVLPQSRRHAFIASLLGIPHIVVAVNKMDLMDFRRDVFEAIRAEFLDFAARLGLQDLYFIPLSALNGDNVVEPSRKMPWYGGRCLLDYLETVPIATDRNLADLRFPVQYVLRPNLDFRGYAGQVASGVIEPGDEVMVLPSRRTSRVKSIVTYDGELPQAFPPMSVTVTLEDEIDISRGDMLAPLGNPPSVDRHIEATVVWMNARPLEPNRQYLLKHTTQQVRASITAIRHRVDINALAHESAGELKLNEIGAVAIETFRPLYFDPYCLNRATGAFILIDPLTNETVAAGMITGRSDRETEGRVTAEERHARLGHRSAMVWFAGDTDEAHALERRLFDCGCLVNVTASQAVARVSAEAGLVSICLGTGDPPEGFILPEDLAALGIVDGEPFTGGAGI
jgi:sulfate adenylyltransferase large subunit